MSDTRRPHGRLWSFARTLSIAAFISQTACAGAGAGGTQAGITPDAAAPSAPATPATAAAAAPALTAEPAVGAAPTGGSLDLGAATARSREDLTNVGIAGRTYFVAMNGDDAASGMMLDTPLRTIERALALAGPGDTIDVRAGTYTPTGNGFTLDRAGSPEARIKLKAHDGEHVILDAAGKAYVLLFPGQSPYWIVEGFELRGGTFYTVKIDSHQVHLVGNDLHGSSNDIIKLVQTSDDVVIYGNEIHHNNAPRGANAQGIDVVGGDRTWIAHNYVHDTASIAIYAKGNSRNTIIENNRVENIPSRGIMLGQSTGVQFMWDGDYESYDGVIRDNIVVNTDDACLATASSINVKILNNSCLNAARLSHGAIFISNESEKQQPGTRIEITNNIIVSAGRPAVKIGPNALTDARTLLLDRNVYWSAGAVSFLSEDLNFAGDIAAWRATTGYDATSIIADPKYADAMLALLPDSPAIDAGLATDLVRHDYRRGPRPLGANADIGAYETR